MTAQNLGKKQSKGNAAQKMPNIKKAVSAGKDAVEKLALTRVAPDVPLGETVKAGWNKTAHIVTVVKNIGWKAVIPVAVADYIFQTGNAWEHGSKIFSGISAGFASIMNQIKPLVAWGAEHAFGTAAIVVGYIALNQMLKFRFKTEPAAAKKK